MVMRRAIATLGLLLMGCTAQMERHDVERILNQRERIRFTTEERKESGRLLHRSWLGDEIWTGWSRLEHGGVVLLRSPELDIKRSSNIEFIRVRFEVPSETEPLRISMAWNDTDLPTDRDLRIFRHDIVLAPGQEHVTISGDNLSDLGFVPDKAINHIFLVATSGDHFSFITGVEIETEESLLRREMDGFKRRFVDGSLRDAVFIQSGGGFVYETELSGSPSELVFGLNSLCSGLITCRVELESGSGDHTIFSRSVDAFGTWQDFRIPLPEVSGQVRLVFESGRGESNTVFWSNQMIIHQVDSRSKPNIVLYLMDALRADHLSLYGYSKPTSPFLEDLSQSGVVASLAFSAASWTKPSVVSLMTSLSPIGHRVGTTSYTETLPDSITTLAEVLSAGGYVTASFSASPLGTTLSNLDQGFDYVVTPAFFLNGDGSGAKVRSDQLTMAVFDWLSLHGDDPFFLYIHTTDPHTPWLATIPEELRDESPEIQAYDAEIRHNDDQLGNLYRRLNVLNENTLFIATSDHGEALGDRGRSGHGWSVYQEEVRVPLVITHSSLEARTDIDIPVDFFDISRTILDVSGVGFDEGRWFGRNLLEPLVERPVFLTRCPYPDDLLGSSTLDRTDMHGVVQYPWKLILNHATDHTRSLELYNLSTDPLELTDLSRERPEIRDELKAILLEYIRQQTSEAAAIPDRTVPGDRNIQLLRSLGYLK